MPTLKASRMLQNLTQIELRKRSGVHQSAISHFERNLLKPSVEQRKALEKALKMPGVIDWGEHGN